MKDSVLAGKHKSHEIIPWYRVPSRALAPNEEITPLPSPIPDLIGRLPQGIKDSQHYPMTPASFRPAPPFYLYDRNERQKASFSVPW